MYKLSTVTKSCFSCVCDGSLHFRGFIHHVVATFEVIAAGYLCGPRESPVVSPVIPLGEPLAVAYPKSIPEGPLPSPSFGSFGPHRAIITSYPALIGNRPFSFGVVVSVRGYFCILRNITFLYPSQHNLQPYFIVQR